MFAKRTDLALEARELWQESAGKTTRLTGVKAVKRKQEGYPVTRVDILDSRGEEALGKPRGSYLTVDLTTFWQRKSDFFQRAVRAVGTPLKELLPTEGPVLVVGLGNRAMTPDAVGPLTADHVLVTRHLISAMPRQFSGFRPVSVLRSGVLGTTGVESAEAVRGLASEVKPACVIAVDALASRRVGRVCAAVQLSDTGIIPGSGVGNHRHSLTKDSLGVPVLAIGVPTVVGAAAIVHDTVNTMIKTLEGSMATKGMGDFIQEMPPDEQYSLIRELLEPEFGNLYVTPPNIDETIEALSYTISEAIHGALF